MIGSSGSFDFGVFTIFFKTRTLSLTPIDKKPSKFPSSVGVIIPSDFDIVLSLHKFAAKGPIPLLTPDMKRADKDPERLS